MRTHKISRAMLWLMTLLTSVVFALTCASCSILEQFLPTPQPSVVTLSGITVSAQPTKTEYLVGEEFDKAGMVVTATYSDDTQKAVTAYTYSPSGALAETDDEITVSYTEGDITKTATVEITVSKPADPDPPAKVLTNLSILNQPAKNEYNVGETFDPTGMSVVAWFGSSKKVLKDTEYTYTPNGVLEEGVDKIVVSYTYGDVTKTVDVAIIVNALDAKLIKANGEWIFEESDSVFENFNRNAEVGSSGGYALGNSQPGATITYTLNAQKAVEGDLVIRVATGMDNRPSDCVVGQVYTITVNGVEMQYSETLMDGQISWSNYVEYTVGRICLVEGENVIVITYTGYCPHNFDYIKLLMGTSSSCAPYSSTLTGITLSGDVKSEYEIGAKFDKTGLVVTANYEDGTSREVMGYTMTPYNGLTADDDKVVVSYTEQGITKTAEMSISVVAPSKDLEKNGVFIFEENKATYNGCGIQDEAGTENGKAFGGFQAGAKVTFTLTASEVTTGKLYLRLATGMGNRADDLTLGQNYKVTVNGEEIVSTTALNGALGWANYFYYEVGGFEVLEENTIIIEYLGVCPHNFDNIKIETGDSITGDAVVIADLKKDGTFVIEEDKAEISGCNIANEAGTTNGKALGGFQEGAKVTFILTASEATTGNMYFRLATGMGNRADDLTLGQNYKVTVNGKEIVSTTALNGALGWANYFDYLVGSVELSTENTIVIEYLGVCPHNFDNIKFELGTDALKTDLTKNGTFVIEEAKATISGCNVADEAGTTNGKALGGFQPGAKVTFTLTCDEATTGNMYFRLATGMDNRADDLTLGQNYKVTVNGKEIVSTTALNGALGWANYFDYLVGEVELSTENTIVIEYLGVCPHNFDNIKFELGTDAVKTDLTKNGTFVIEEAKATISGCNVADEAGTTNGKALGGMGVGGTATITFTLTCDEATTGKLYIRLATGMDNRADDLTLGQNYKVTVNGKEIVSTTALDGTLGWANYFEYLVGEVELSTENTIVIEYLGVCPHNVDNIKLVLGTDAA